MCESNNITNAQVYNIPSNGDYNMCESNNITNAQVYNIPTYRMEDFKKKLKKLANKADQLGCDDITYEITGEHMTKFQDGRVIRFTHVEVSGTTPTYNGFEFIAKVEHDRTGLPVIKSAPGQVLPEDQREQSTFCDHCQTNRFRKNTYVVRGEETGKYVNIGSTCVKDFLGWNKSPDTLASFMTGIYELSTFAISADWEPNERMPDGWEWEMCLEEYLTHVAVATTRNGWVSKRAASENEMLTPTSFWVNYTTGLHLMDPRVDDDFRATIAEMRDEVYNGTKARELAVKAVEWASTLTDTRNEYMYNVKNIGQRGTVSTRTIGIATSIIAAYERAMEIAAKAAGTGVDFMKSEYVGAEGKRMTKTEVVCHSIYEVPGTDWQGDPCTKDKVTFLDTNGNVLVWFCSGVNKFTKGMKASINATVTKHKINSGKLQYKLTGVSRVHLVKEL